MSGIIIGILYIDRDAHSERNDKRLDWLGAFVITAGLVLVVFAMNSSSTAPNGWRTPCQYYHLRNIYTGALLLLKSVIVRRRHRHLTPRSRAGCAFWSVATLP